MWQNRKIESKKKKDTGRELWRLSTTASCAEQDKLQISYRISFETFSVVDVPNLVTLLIDLN